MSYFRNVEHKVIFEKLTDLPLYDDFCNACAGSGQPGVDRIGQYISEVASRIQTLSTNQNNPYYRFVVSERKGIGKLIVFTKRVIRRVLKWLIEPICAQQSEIGRASCRERV